MYRNPQDVNLYANIYAAVKYVNCYTTRLMIETNADDDSLTFCHAASELIKNGEVRLINNTTST